MTQQRKRYFGTDGIRGKVGESLINPEFILKLGWAVGRVLANGSCKRVLIGKDTRISGYLLESALEAGLSSAGVNIGLLGPMPTPGIAYLTRTLRASAGIVISASHNHFEDNGIKFFGADGCKLADDVQDAIEAQLGKGLEVVPSSQLGKAFRITDARGRYIEFCKSSVPYSMRLDGFKIVIDCANGAAYQVAGNVFRELGAEVHSIGSEPNGLNINSGCGSTQPEALQKMVLNKKADVGIALDGDGDRVVMVDAKGNVRDGDELIYVMCQDRVETELMHGGVVGTYMANKGCEKAINALGVEFERVPVGDRYVMQRLQERGWELGGEGSGHIVCLNKTSTGDGIISALQVLFAMSRKEKALHELLTSLDKFPQVLINVESPAAQDILSRPPVQSMVTELENILENCEGRILLRPSGTEPLVRVMVEGRDHAQVNKCAQQLADFISAQS